MALGFGVLGDFSDLLLGFWGTALVIFLPLLGLLAWWAKRLIVGLTGKLLAALFFVFGLIYPTAAGLDGTRQSLYLNLCGFLFLALAVRQLADELRPLSSPLVESPGIEVGAGVN